LPAVRRNLDDAPAALRAKVRQRDTDKLDRSEQVGRDDVFDLLVRELFRRAEQAVASVADDHIDEAEPLRAPLPVVGLSGAVVGAGAVGNSN
jgi:hypothetical protein